MTITKLEKLISKRIGQAIFKYKMIEPGDKILMAVSGGKDSMTLLYDLIKRRKSFPVPYEILAVHIKTDFCQCCKNSDMERKFEEWGVEYRIIPVPVLERVQSGKKMNCYWCSTQRRLELMKVAEAEHCTKIALGHHLDDIIETLFMNICYNAEISTMLPRFRYRKFPYTVIRPLALVSEAQIIKFAEFKNITRLICKCPYGRNSKRLDIRNAIKKIAARDPAVRLNIYRSMSNVNLEYLVDDKLRSSIP